MHLLLGILLATIAAEPELERVGRLSHPPIREASGIVKSRRYRDVYWVHNDSQNSPALFAVRADGSLIREFAVAMPNVDWEDMAIDDDGHLYLGEIGNNGNRLPLRAIYRLDEPDPSKPRDEPLPVTRSTFYKFPPDGRFDAEGLFIEGKRAIIVAKTNDGRDAELFAIPLDPPAPLLRPALPERVGTLPGFTEPATGASLSRDGKRLAVCSYSVLRVYEKSKSNGWVRLSTIRYGSAAIEAVCWDGNDLVLASESRDMYRITEAAWRRGKP